MTHNVSRSPRGSRRRGLQRRGGGRLGCLIALVVLLLLFVAGVLTAVIMWRSFAAWGAGELVNKALDQVPMEEAERAEVDLVVTEMVEDVKRGRLSVEDVGAVAKTLAEGPAGMLIASEIMKQQYLYPSELSEQEKSEGARTIERLVIGLDRDMIPDEQVEAILAPISARSGSSSVKLDSEGLRTGLKPPADVTPKQLRTVLSLAEDAVDEAQVPDEGIDVDLAKELREAVESVKAARKDASARDEPDTAGVPDAASAEESPPGEVTPGGVPPSGP